MEGVATILLAGASQCDEGYVVMGLMLCWLH